MAIFETLIKRYRTQKSKFPLYQCISCQETEEATTLHIVCPQCGDKLERIDLLPTRDQNSPQFKK